MRAFLSRLLRFLLICMLLVPLAAARTIEFETSEVTAADVTLSPDGQWLVFTMLGHLFRLPVDGGTAEQLTFGPYYDTDPVFSPDGARVAFVSDRDGSESNVFVLELATGQITQVTHESWAGRPTWTPDGQAIVYLQFVPQAAAGLWLVPALVRRVVVSGGELETLSAPPRLLRSVFYLPDGRLAWTAIERETESPRSTTRIEVMSAEGTISTLRTLEGIAHRVVASPTGDGLYCRHLSSPRQSGWHPEEEELLFLPLPDGAERQIVPVTGTGRRDWGPRFAVAADNKTLYLGEAGRIWRIALPSGRRQLTPFRARVELEIQEPVPPPRWVPAALGSPAPPRSILQPRLSPDGRTLVFGAAGYLWQQQVDGGPAQRLFEGSAWESDAAFSPDGKRLAFVHSEHGKAEIRVFDFESGETRSLLAAEDPENLSWNPDGRQVAFTDSEEEVKVFDLASGQTRTVASGDFHPGLSWSADTQQLIFCDHNEDGTHRVVAVNLSDGTRKVLADELPRGAGEVQLSADGQSLYFSARGGEIWVAPLGKKSAMEEDIRRLSPEGGDTYTFTSDSSAVTYSAGHRVWRHPLDGGEREEIPVRLELQRPTPPPLLVRRVRVLDFASGSFGRETSLYIEQGRIRWIGSEDGRELPSETVTVDAGGRSAIPGLFDLHVHAEAANLANQDAFLAYGVTSVRDTGGRLAWLNALADRGEATSDPVPRYFYSGYAFSPRWIHTQDEARTYVRRWKDWGAHFLKAHFWLPWSLHRAVAEEAYRLDLPVIGHGTTVAEITKSVTLGYVTLEHAGFRFYNDVLQMLVSAGTRWDATVGNTGGENLLLHDEPERFADAKFRTFTPESHIHWAQTQSSLWEKRVLPGVLLEQLATLRAAHRQGVKLLAGTDAPLGMAFFGSSLHWELELFVQAGLPPLEVLRIATQEAAAAVGAEDDLGTLEPGKLADIILLDANPLEDIRNTQTIWRVIKGGWLFDPEKLRPPESTSTTK